MFVRNACLPVLDNPMDLSHLGYVHMGAQQARLIEIKVSLSTQLPMDHESAWSFL